MMRPTVQPKKGQRFGTKRSKDLDGNDHAGQYVGAFKCASGSKNRVHTTDRVFEAGQFRFNIL